MTDNIDRDALIRSAADECMTPDQFDQFVRIGEQDRDVYTRFYRCIAKRIPPAELEGQTASPAIGATDGMERRALLLHLGDVIEAIACVTKCAHRYNTIGEAVRQEESLMTFSILQEVEPEMTPLEFVTRAAGAYFLWPKALLDVNLNRRSLAHLVEHDLFADNEAGWKAYVEDLHADVPWFGRGLGAEHEPDLPPLGDASPPGHPY
ncbi:hypothetical protein [Paraburkholderia sp. SIMBA_054]|uniref:hypothetical protein n=1 Tax=Paraburkholderia sp. SIMBA_054 TaxID=3085795 RepID=UPI00397CA2BE